MPTVGRSVQFRGIKNAVKAYENMDIAPWGLFQGTQFLMKYEGTSVEDGSALLQEYLSALDLRSADSNTYTLCIYDSPGVKINNSTKYDASFNFRLVDNFADHADTKIAGTYENRLAGIEETLKQLVTPEPEELTPKDKLWDAIGKILEHPQVQQALATKVLTIVDGLGDAVGSIFKKPGYRPAAIGQTTTAQSENEKLQEAVNILVKVDTQLGTNLLRLAHVAERDPEKYKTLIGMLNLL